MTSSESNGADHVVELIVHDASQQPPPPSSSDDSRDNVDTQIAPLLSHTDRPKINIFTASYPRRKPRDEVTRLLESESLSPFTQCILWIWNGSRYSGLLCMALSSIVYFLMGLLSNLFSVQAIPLFETAFTRCTIILIMSYLWLRRSEQPLFGASNVRLVLLLRALTGCISMSSFIYCFQRLPFSQAIVLNSTTPIMASVMARFFLREKLKIADIASLACSFIGVLFFFREMLATQEQVVKVAEVSNAKPSHHIFEILVGIFSSIIGGTSYCLIKAGAKASDQPLLTVFSFGILASPAMGLCTYIFEDFVLPRVESILLMLVLGVLAFFAEVLLARGLQLERMGKVANIQYIEDFVLPRVESILLMLVLGVLAFFAEVLLARGLQLERMGKVANIQYMEAGLNQFWRVALTLVSPALEHLIGILLIVVSVFFTMYIGPDKETE